ncbi:MAG: lipopolysaccharide biosynthesis protein [Clostridia bacterium]|nr:lipopolysaccharide biosynthesis protein [Clostridia bacterium]
MSTELNKKSTNALAWSSFAEIMAKLVTPIVNIILARLLTPDAFGAVATITMVITFAEVFTDAGFQKYIVQHKFKNNEELNNGTNVAFLTNLTLSALIVIIIVIFRHQLAKLVGSDSLGNAIAVASLSIILVAFSSIQIARFRRDLDFKSLFFVRIGAAIIPLIVTVPLAFILRNFWALVIGTLSVNLFNAVTLTIKSDWKPKFFYKFSIFKEMFSFSAWTLLESISIWLTVNIDIFIIGNKLSDYHLGIYKTSIQTVNSSIGMISAAILPVLFSTLSKCQNDCVELKNTYLKFQKYTSLLLIPLGFGLFLYNDLVTYILLGKQWNEAAQFIGVFGLVYAFLVLFSYFASELYRSTGNPKLSIIIQLIHIAILIISIEIAVSYSFSLLCIARAITQMCSILAHIIFVRFLYKIPMIKSLLNIMPALTCSIIMLISGIILRQVSSSIWWQFVVILICVIIYIFSLFLLFRKTKNELLQTDIAQKLFHILPRYKR